MQFNRSSSAETRFFLDGLRCWVALAAFAFVCVAGVESVAFGQEKKPAAKADKDASGPQSEDLELQTGDGLLLMISYYPGVDRDAIERGKGKRVVPIVLLHGLKQSRKDYEDLAKNLQSRGFAVIVPDLRGHGESIRKKGAGRDDTLDAAKMPAGQFGLMVTEDMKAVKNFLWEKNNAGELNIDKLCVVGSEMGASVALGFAAFDAIGYDAGAVYYGPRKLGRFVKAVVLISPKWSVPGLPLTRALSVPDVQSDISLMILVGKSDPKALREAKQIYNKFEPWHNNPAGNDKVEDKTLIFGKLDTNLQGMKLLDPKFGVQDYIKDFVEHRLIKSDAAREWTWKERKTADD
jgi:alpha-beta hydrolase superfamily lysophospholipase